MPTFTDRGEWNPNLVYRGTNDGTNSTGGDTVFWLGATYAATYYTVDSNPQNLVGWQLVSGTSPSGTSVYWTAGVDSTIGTAFPNNGGYKPGNVYSVQVVPAPIAGAPTDPTNDNSALGAPYSLSAATDHSLTVSWNAAKVPGIGEVSSYNVLVNGTQVGTTSGTGTSFTITNLAPATSYQVSVVAVDSIGASGPTDLKSASGVELNPAQGANPVMAFSTTGAHISTGKYFTPYIDVGLPNYDLYTVSKQSGISNFTLAFQNSAYANLDASNYVQLAGGAAPNLLAGHGPSISFGGLAALNTPTGALIDEINQIQHAEGGTITASIGGYTGVDPAVIAGEYATYLQTSAGGGLSASAATAKASSSLQGEYQSVMNTYGINHLDFDIETEASYTYVDSSGKTQFTNDPTSVSGATTHIYQVANDTAANALRNSAIIALEAANPGMNVTFTVATNTTGLSSSTSASNFGGDVLDMVNTAIASGVRIDALNLMVMDFNSSDTVNGSSNQADRAIAAANAVHAQFPSLKIALTPMIGQNDSNSGVTSLADAARITAFAQANPWVVGIGEWQLGRDQYAASASTSSTVMTYQSGVAQSQWQFSTILNGGTSLNRASFLNDHNGDGVSDVVLQNTSGTVVNWTMMNGAYQSGANLATGANGYSVVAQGDFNGDRTSDVVLQNGNTVVAWTLKNGAYQSGSMLTSNAGGYTVVGAGDFNGDGTSDIVLQNGNSVVQWTMKNGAYQSGSVVSSNTGGFKVVGVGDFNGDGTSDLLLQMGDTVVEYTMKNGAMQSSTTLTTNAGGYKVVGVGDFNGDGVSDVLLQNGASVVDWIVQNGAVTSTNIVSTGASGYTVVGTGDYNGDGTSDVLVQNTSSGQVVAWTMLVGQYHSGSVLTNNAGGFTVVGG